MIIAIDTNRYRDFCDGSDQAVARFQMAEHIMVPFPVLTELRSQLG